MWSGKSHPRILHDQASRPIRSRRGASWAAAMVKRTPHRRGGVAGGLRHQRSGPFYARSTAHRPARAARRRHHVLPVLPGPPGNSLTGALADAAFAAATPATPVPAPLQLADVAARFGASAKGRSTRRTRGDPGCGGLEFAADPDPALRPRHRHSRAVGGRAEAAAADAGRHHGVAVHRLRAPADAAAEPHARGLDVPDPRHVGARPQSRGPPQGARGRRVRSSPCPGRARAHRGR